MSVQSIGPQDLARRCTQGCPIDLIDVRTPLEFLEVHAAAARNVPLDQLEPDAVLRCRQAAADDPLYVICRSGARGQQACQKFLAMGFSNVVNVEGGTMAWEKCGLPVHRGKKTISLQRQVQITAGSMALVGSLLGWFVHPAFIAIPAAVGLGLLFTGLTDNCMMGLLLARLPWNRGDSSGVGCVQCASRDAAGKTDGSAVSAA